MSNCTFIAGSFPKIVTTSRPRRKDETSINDPFIKKYIKLIAELLMIKKELKDIKIGYIGGYEQEENNNTAKLYFSALSYCFKELGYGSLSKENFIIFDKEKYIEDSNNFCEQMQKVDFLFLGLGDDSKFGEFLELLYNDGIDLKKYIRNNNMLVTGVCAGSVVTSNKIYGGSYDSFYHDRPKFNYPVNYPTLNINRVTMETNLFPESQTNEKNEEFKSKCLIPDSYQMSFFAARPNSFIIMNNKNVYAIGEIYLYIDGKDILISKDDIIDITSLNDLVNAYNLDRSIDTKRKIEAEINNLKKVEDFKCFKEDFKILEVEKEEKRKSNKIALFNYLNEELDEIENVPRNILPNSFNLDFLTALNLETTNFKEMYVKYNLLGVIKKVAINYPLETTYFLDDLYDFFKKLVIRKPNLTLYFIECFSSFYPNKKMKDLLSLCKSDITKKVNALNINNAYFKKLLKAK